MFKWQDKVSDIKVRSDIEKLGINSESHRACLRQCLVTNTLSNIRKPTLEICLAAMRIETHIVKSKSHPTGMIRGCFRCNEKVNNTEHVLYHCPIARFIWDIVRDLMRIMIGTKIRIDVKGALINI